MNTDRLAYVLEVHGIPIAAIESCAAEVVRLHEAAVKQDVGDMLARGLARLDGTSEGAALRVAVFGELQSLAAESARVSQPAISKRVRRLAPRLQLWPAAKKTPRGYH